MSEYYGNNDWRDYLAHYGVKGMRWGKRKQLVSRKKRVDSNGKGVYLRTEDIKTKHSPYRKTIAVVDLDTNTIVEKPTIKKRRPLSRKKRIDNNGSGVHIKQTNKIIKAKRLIDDVLKKKIKRG